MNIKSLFSGLLTMLPLAVSAQQPAPLPLDPDVRYGQLENGLTYYVRHNEEPRERANFYIAQKVGSVQEEENQRGLAHFLEHMCFNGTTHFAGNRIVGYCESIGVKFGQNLNAYTSTDETVYNINDVPTNISSNIDSCLLILRDWSDGLLLEPAEIDKERGVIHEEWRMRTSGFMRILNRNLETLYPDSRYGKRMPIGLMSIVDNFKPEELRAYYEKWYRPDLQAVIVVGDIDAADVEQRIIKTFSDIQMPQNPAQYETYPVPDNNEPIYVVDKDPEMRATQIMISFKQDAMSREEKSTVLKVLRDFSTEILSEAFNTRLNELARNADCPYTYASLNYGNYLLSKTKDELGLVIIPKPGKDLESIEVVMTELERARQFGITDSELYRARQSVMSNAEKQYENRDKQKNSFFVHNYVRHFLEGDAFPGIELEYQIYQSLDKSLPSDVYNKIIAEASASVDTNFVFLGLYPEKDDIKLPTIEQVKQAIANARNAKVTAYVDNVKDEPLIAKLPKKGKIKSEKASYDGYTLLTLSNGIKLYYKQTDFENTEILMNAISMGGNARIAPADIKNSKLFSDIAGSTGLGTFSGIELEKTLAGKQVSLRYNLGSTSETISGRSTPKDLRTLFEMVHLAFTTISNDVDGYNSVINNYRTSLDNADKNPLNAFIDTVNATIHNHHPLVKRLKKADLDEISYDTYKRLYTDRILNPTDFDFYFVGALSPDSIKLFAEQYIATLPKGKKREAYKKSDLTYAKGVIENKFIRQMETPQAYALQVWSGDITYSVKNDVIVNFLASILDMRYTHTIREEAGISYTVSVSGNVTANNDDKYIIQIVSPFRPAQSDSLLLLIRESIDDIAKNGVTAEEIENVRKFELKDYADSQRKNNYWLSTIVAKTFVGIDVRTGYEDAVKSVTSDDIKNFVNNVMLRDNNCATIIMLPEDFQEGNN